jgi:hypothetical protein
MSFKSFFKFFEKFAKLISFDVIYPEQPIQDENSRNKRIKRVMKTCRKVHFWLVLALSFFISIMMATNLAVETTDYKTITETVPFVISMIADVCKAVWFTVKKKEVCDIIRKLASIHPDTKQKQIKYGFKRYLKNFMVLQMTYLSIGIATAVCFAINSGSKIQADGKQFAADVWMPFNRYQNGVYQLISVILTFVFISTMVLSISLFFLLLTIIMLVSKGFECLRMDIVDIKDSSEGDKSEDLKNLIERHVELHDLVEQVENLLKPVFLLKRVHASMVICFTGFQLSTSNEITVMINYGLYLLAVAVKNFFLCYGSQQIIDSSEGIAEAIYEINWYEIKDLKLRKELLLIMMRSQNASKLTAGKFSVVCLESFKFMLNTAYSYFTLLKAVYSTQ